MNEGKIGFFSRAKIAIFKLEEYGKFLNEKISLAVKYFFLIVLIYAIGISAIGTYNIMKTFTTAYNYIKNETPDFSFSGSELNIEKNVNAYDEKYDFYFIADTSDTLDSEKIENYKKSIKSNGVLLLKDKVIYKIDSSEYEESFQSLSEEYKIPAFDKNELIEKISSIGIVGLSITIFIAALLGIYIAELISVFFDWIMMAVFAVITASIIRINLSFKQAFNLSIYAFTLPILFSFIYEIAYSIFGFNSQYFRMIYLLITYVYIVAAILMIKSDLVKQHIEVQKIVEIQKQVKEDEEEQATKDEKEETNEDENDNDNKDEKNNKEDNNISNEPDGSEI